MKKLIVLCLFLMSFSSNAFECYSEQTHGGNSFSGFHVTVKGNILAVVRNDTFLDEADLVHIGGFKFDQKNRRILSGKIVLNMNKQGKPINLYHKKHKKFELVADNFGCSTKPKYKNMTAWLQRFIDLGSIDQWIDDAPGSDPLDDVWD